jgi:hypothetical protein
MPEEALLPGQVESQGDAAPSVRPEDVRHAGLRAFIYAYEAGASPADLTLLVSPSDFFVDVPAARRPFPQWCQQWKARLKTGTLLWLGLLSGERLSPEAEVPFEESLLGVWEEAVGNPGRIIERQSRDLSDHGVVAILVAYYPGAEDWTLADAAGAVGHLISLISARIFHDNHDPTRVLTDRLQQGTISSLSEFSSDPIGEPNRPLAWDEGQPFPSEWEGKLIAWDQEQKRVLAVASNYKELIDRVLAIGEKAAWVERVRELTPANVNPEFALLEGESPNILDDICIFFRDTDLWLDAPNAHFGGLCPRTLLQTPEEWVIRDYLRGIRCGITT